MHRYSEEELRGDEGRKSGEEARGGRDGGCLGKEERERGYRETVGKGKKGREEGWEEGYWGEGKSSFGE